MAESIPQPPLVNIDDLEYRDIRHGERFGSRMGEIAGRIGARKLGYNLTEIAPGRRAFPRHSHRVNEEMFFVLSGEGELKFGNETHPIRSGDVIACPPGGPEVAHQIRNTSNSTTLRFLAVSTMEWPEIVECPDSGKFGVRSGPGGEPDSIRFNGRLKDSLDYWDGE